MMQDEQNPLTTDIQSNPVTAPTTAPETPPVAAMPSVNPPKKKKGLVIGIVIAAVVVLLAGGAAAAYQFIYQNPEKVVTDALQSVLTAKTLSTKGTIVYDQDDVKLFVTFNAKSDDAGAGEVGVEATIEAQGETFNVNASGLLDKDGLLYFKIKDVKKLVISYFSSLGVTDTSFLDDLIAKVDDKWIRISEDDINELSAEAGTTQACVTEAYASFKTDAKQQDELGKLYEKNRFIVIGESLGSKTIDGVDSIGYAVSVDDTKFKDFYKGIGDTQLGKKMVGCDDSIDFSDTSDFDSETSSDADVIKVWASRFGHQLSELELSGKSEDDASVKIVLNPTANKPVTIETPSVVVKLEDVMQDIQELFVAQ
jgi:flagellar basal body-associated protein FliL